MEHTFTQEERKQWNAILLRCLKGFIDICETYNLSYFCVGGTVIGAVRHNGLIPWDDDIDVAMPRQDYNRFIQICNSTDIGDFELASPAMKGYPFFFSKFCDKNTSLIEIANVPCMYGVYIDVFPIDGTAETLEEATKQMKRFKRWSNKLNAVLAHLTVKEYLKLASCPHEWGRMLIQTLVCITSREWLRKLIIRKLDNIAQTYEYNDATYVANFGGAWAEKEISKKEWITPVSTHLFEGLEVNIPGNYDAYLTRIYGDYMQLPPEEKRVSHHDHAFVNLHERVDSTIF